MSWNRWLLSILAVVTLLSTGCQPLAVPAEYQSSVSEGVQTASSVFEGVQTAEYGRFNGIDYVRHAGIFVGSDPGKPYRVAFEIVAPADPARGNGRMLVESYHFASAARVREVFLTPEFLFGRGFSHAAVCSEPVLAGYVEVHPCLDFPETPATSAEILADFASSLKGGEAATMVGNIDFLYGAGLSKSSEPLQEILRSSMGVGLFDLTYLVTTGWPLPLWPVPVQPMALLPDSVPDSFAPDPDSGRVILLQSEADVIVYNGAVMRRDMTSNHFRIYEVAGGPHIVNPPWLAAGGVNWLPVFRALFVSGDLWMTEGVDPPANTLLESASEDEVDAVYGFVTGIARDEDLNALGGVRLPDIALGRAQFIAADMENFPLNGVVQDLACTPRSDGSPRFESHAAYVAQVVTQAEQLVNSRFLLPEDAYQMIAEAAGADSGECAASEP